MAIFHVHQHQSRPKSFSKLFITISVPLFCLLSWVSSTTTTTLPLPIPPPSAVAASKVLKSRGYSLFAAVITAATAGDTESWNGTGTVFAPPDFAFSFAAAKFNNHRRSSPPPRPTASLLLHHTLKEPLTWQNLTARSNGDELPVWHANRCVFISKNFNGRIGIVGAKKSVVTIKIRQPDLYVDEHLVVHGVNDVLEPTFLSKCSFPEQTAPVKSQIDRSFLDHAVRALRKRGFSVVATAMAIKLTDLINLTDFTVFAPSDASLFADSTGFRFDFLNHVVAKRHHFTDIANLSSGTTIETLSPNKKVIIRSENGDVTADGVAIHSSEVYHNRWIVVLSVSRSIDDARDSEARIEIPGRLTDSGHAGTPVFPPIYSGVSAREDAFVGGLSDSSSPASTYVSDSEVTSQFPGKILEFELTGGQFPRPIFPGDETSNIESQAPTSNEDCEQSNAAENPRRSNSPETQGETLPDCRYSTEVSPVKSNGFVSTISHMVEREEHLFCPVTVRSRLDSGALTSLHVKQSPPSTSYGQLSEKLVQSGPSHQFNKLFEVVIESVPSDENVTGR
ncbi:hypothetical protein U1Q18_023158 [Sarracenia purpurea var. burkii]